MALKYCGSRKALYQPAQICACALREHKETKAIARLNGFINLKIRKTYFCRYEKRHLRILIRVITDDIERSTAIAGEAKTFHAVRTRKLSGVFFENTFKVGFLYK